jgi:hypothetical protein
MAQPEPLLAIAGLVFPVVTLTVLSLAPRALRTTPTALLLAQEAFLTTSATTLVLINH